MNNLLIRTISGLLFVILVLGSALLHPYVFALLFWIISLLGMKEFYTINRFQGKTALLIAYLSGSWLYLSTTLLAHHLVPSYNHILLILNLLFMGLPFLAELFSQNEKPFTRVAISLLGIIYIPLPLALLNFFFYPGMVKGPPEPMILVCVFSLIWINDIFAYLIGSLLGRHKLFERISPKKTWEGSFGGAFFCLSSAWLISRFFPVLETWQWLVLSLTIILAGTLGDLVESMLKRSYQLKDSGQIMPGHGGILDRFDATLAVAPTTFIILALFWS